MSRKKAIQYGRASKCSIITSTIDIPYLEKQLSGDVMVTWSALSKLHCEDLCLRDPACIGFNYNNHVCELLSDVYPEQDKGVSITTRDFMRKVMIK